MLGTIDPGLLGDLLVVLRDREGSFARHDPPHRSILSVVGWIGGEKEGDESVFRPRREAGRQSVMSSDRHPFEFGERFVSDLAPALLFQVDEKRSLKVGPRFELAACHLLAVQGCQARPSASPLPAIDRGALETKFWNDLFQQRFDAADDNDFNFSHGFLFVVLDKNLRFSVVITKVSPNFLMLDTDSDSFSFLSRLLK